MKNRLTEAFSSITNQYYFSLVPSYIYHSFSVESFDGNVTRKVHSVRMITDTGMNQRFLYCTLLRPYDEAGNCRRPSPHYFTREEWRRSKGRTQKWGHQRKKANLIVLLTQLLWEKESLGVEVFRCHLETFRTVRKGSE